jgi:hypothetical protein
VKVPVLKELIEDNAMTFDELWRLDLERKSGVDSAAKEREVVRSDTAPDAADEAEVNRFLEWLEKSLMIDNSDGTSVR